MENATKALLMAASVLIGVVILSLGVYLFLYLGSYAEGVEDQNKDNQIAQFNSQFLSYQGKEGLTIYDVITVANMAKDYNEENGYTNSSLGYINVVTPISGVGSIPSNGNNPGSANNISEIQKNIPDAIGKEEIEDGKKVYKLKTYKCTNVEIDSETSRVSTITITK